MRGNAVVIQGELKEPFALDEANLRQAIQNIKESLHEYWMQSAYDRQIQIYEGALEYLTEHKETE
jgi:hypothetical protein